jgi:formate-dependent nitrite reductase membrane component NrfD
MWSPYGRRTDRAPGSVLPAGQHGDARAGAERDGHDSATTYYGRPVVKRSPYGWLIASYLFIGGLAGAAQVIATLANLLGGRSDRATVRAGRYVALGGALVSPVLLIADLHAKSRWFNMLRIFRPTSAMSIGSWTMAMFGALSGLVAAGQFSDDVLGAEAGRRTARWLGLPAAGAGAMMSVYTGTLLAATSTPLWAAGYRQLPPLFGATAMSTATAALMLLLRASGASTRAERRLTWIGMIGAISQLVITRSLDRQWRAAGLDRFVDRPAFKGVYRGGVVGLGMVLPLALQAVSLLSGGKLRWLMVPATLAALAGGYAERSLIVFAGNHSADDPDAYHRVTEPGATAAVPLPTVVQQLDGIAAGRLS